jgi:hypothetical protein
MLLRDSALLLPAQAGLDYHKEAALQHAGRSLALAARGDPRLAVPDPPAFARPALERQTLEHKPSKHATGTEATAHTGKGRMGREVAVSRMLRPPAPVHDAGWKPRVRSSPAASRRFCAVAAHKRVSCKRTPACKQWVQLSCQVTQPRVCLRHVAPSRGRRASSFA